LSSGRWYRAERPGRLHPVAPILAVVVTASMVAWLATATAASDSRTRMQAVDTTAAIDAASPDPSLLPTGAEWVTHITDDLLPYWTTPEALGNPLGNFPTLMRAPKTGPRR
jgi:hypothetical protein